MPASELRKPAASSTTRIAYFMLASRRQLHHEARAARLVVLRPDRAEVLLHDAAHDREPEPAAAPLGREVRHEELVAVRGRDARAVVAHAQAHASGAAVVLGQELDPALAVGRLDRV